LRSRFAAAERKYVSVNNVVGKFATTALGVEFVAAYRAARMIRDAGHGPSAAAAAAVAPTPVV